MRVKDSLLEARRFLDCAAVGDASLEAEVLLRHALGMDRACFYASLDCSITPNQGSLLQHLLERRLGREPLAYILGYKEFYGIPLLVNPDVLVPRPETELLVDKALELAGAMALGDRLILADIGTGSGAIAIALAVYLPQATIYATDISAKALAVASENSRTHRVQERVHLVEGDLLEPLPQPVDLIVANLPYLRDRDIPGLEPEVLLEPREALDGGPQGLDLIGRLLHQAPARLKDGGAIILEVDQSQAAEVTRIAQEVFPEAHVQVARDLAALDRAVVVQNGRIVPVYLPKVPLLSTSHMIKSSAEITFT